MTKGYPFKGTLWYASVRSHERYSHSRRDDLEGLAYTIIHYMTGGNNDWERIQSTEVTVTTAKQNEFIASKRNFIDGRQSETFDKIREFIRYC